MASLDTINFNSGSLTGNLPSELGQLGSLTYLDVCVRFNKTTRLFFFTFFPTLFSP